MSVCCNFFATSAQNAHTIHAKTVELYNAFNMSLPLQNRHKLLTNPPVCGILQKNNKCSPIPTVVGSEGSSVQIRRNHHYRNGDKSPKSEYSSESA